MWKFSTVVVIACFSFFEASAQKSTAPKKDSVVLTDIFHGNSPTKKFGNEAQLVLKHCPYCDMGTFALTATHAYSIVCNSTTINGEWTVLKGSATNDNATVVELDMTDGKPLYYYLRLKNGDLQQLDSTLHEIKPQSKHLLKKQ